MNSGNFPLIPAAAGSNNKNAASVVFIYTSLPDWNFLDCPWIHGLGILLSTITAPAWWGIPSPSWLSLEVKEPPYSCTTWHMAAHNQRKSGLLPLLSYVGQKIVGLRSVDFVGKRTLYIFFLLGNNGFYWGKSKYNKENLLILKYIFLFNIEVKGEKVREEEILAKVYLI